MQKMEEYGLEKALKDHIKRTGMPQAQIARRLNYTPSQFNRWVKGTNRISGEAIIRFCDLIDKLVGLSDEERVNLFKLAGHLTIEEASLSRGKIDEIVTPPTYLPPKTYHELIGRDNELVEILDLLRDIEHWRIISIVGLGGMGKTALAREVTIGCQKNNLFDYIVWRSAKSEYFENERIVERGVSSYSFDELLSDIGRQCNRLDITQMPFEQKKVAVSWLLTKKQVLVVLDNLETVESYEELIGEMAQILGQGKLLITSRHKLKREDTYQVELSGLSEIEGIELLQVEAEARNIQQVKTAQYETLAKIREITGGAPLAMKLVVGQLSRQPMNVVLEVLVKASRQGQDYKFYRFIYWYSWRLLDDEAHGVWVDMSVFPPVTGGSVTDVETVSQIEGETFWRAMDQLVLMSLVDRIGELNKERFALHPLTYYFIRSDITRDWEDDS